MYAYILVLIDRALSLCTVCMSVSVCECHMYTHKTGFVSKSNVFIFLARPGGVVGNIRYAVDLKL